MIPKGIARWTPFAALGMLIPPPPPGAIRIDIKVKGLRKRQCVSI
jgi:hypothetical protein